MFQNQIKQCDKICKLKRLLLITGASTFPVSSKTFLAKFDHKYFLLLILKSRGKTHGRWRSEWMNSRCQLSGRKNPEWTFAISEKGRRVVVSQPYFFRTERPFSSAEPNFSPSWGLIIGPQKSFSTMVFFLSARRRESRKIFLYFLSLLKMQISPFPPSKSQVHHHTRPALKSRCPRAVLREVCTRIWPNWAVICPRFGTGKKWCFCNQEPRRAFQYEKVESRPPERLGKRTLDINIEWVLNKDASSQYS